MNSSQSAVIFFYLSFLNSEVTLMCCGNTILISKPATQIFIYLFYDRF